MPESSGFPEGRGLHRSACTGHARALNGAGSRVGHRADMDALIDAVVIWRIFKIGAAFDPAAKGE